MYLFKYEAIYYFSCFTKNGARWALRKRDEADTRKMQVLLTSKGKAEALEYRKIYKQADQILLGAISDSELKLLYELLDKLSLAMEDVL